MTDKAEELKERLRMEAGWLPGKRQSIHWLAADFIQLLEERLLFANERIATIGELNAALLDRAETAEAELAEIEAERELVSNKLAARNKEVVIALRRAEAAEAERNNLWAAMEQVSSGTIMLNGKRHDIEADDAVFEWADQIIAGTHDGLPETRAEQDEADE